MSDSRPDAPREGGLDGQMDQVYSTLRTIARRAVRGRTGRRILEPTELVHEVYLKLARSHRESLARAELLALAASALRSVLVDHARELATLRRGSNHRHVTLNGGALEQRSEVDILALHESLNRLAALDPRMAKVVELRFFAGLELDEIAAALGVSSRTVDKDWALAKAWLHRELA